MNRLIAAWVAVTAVVLFVVCAAPRSTHVDFVAFLPNQAPVTYGKYSPTRH